MNSFRHAAAWGYLDDWGHRLHLPGFIQNRLCDWWDRAIGVYDPEPMTFTEYRAKRPGDERTNQMWADYYNAVEADRKTRNIREETDAEAQARIEQALAEYYQGHKDDPEEWGDPE